MSHRVLHSAQNVVSKLLEAPVADPDTETEAPAKPDTDTPARPDADPEPDEKPNPFRRREIKPGHEPSPKACESKARRVVSRLIEGTVEEKLTKKDPSSKWIKDFEKSDNPKFAGKSKSKRRKMALAAYYAKKRS